MNQVKKYFLKEFNEIVKEMNEEEFSKLLKNILKVIEEMKREEEEND